MKSCAISLLRFTIPGSRVEEWGWGVLREGWGVNARMCFNAVMPLAETKTGCLIL